MDASSVVRLKWRGPEAHASVVASWVSAHGAEPGHHVAPDLSILVQGHSLPCHRAVVAAASPYLASLLQDESETLSIPGLNYSQVIYTYMAFPR